jgi:hypothetical protein
MVATVVHHREAHRGDMTLFLDYDNLESCCASCHNKIGQLEDHGKTFIAFGADGYPL